MGWQDRDYNRGGGGGGDYLSNPGAILGLSLPFGRWFGVRVRLHFWLLITIAMSIASVIRGMHFVFVVLDIAILLIALLIHDFGHRIAAKWVGGSHDEFMLWPFGGMIFPTLPPGAWPMFLGYVGGLLANLAIVVACWVGEFAMVHEIELGNWNPLLALGWGLHGGPLDTSAHGLILYFLVIISLTNVAVIVANLLPYYWFDGGALLQSILWPWIGCYQAINVTCILGMLIAAPMVLWSMSGQAFLAMVFWALLFSSSFTKRRELVANGTGEVEQAIAFSAMNPAPTSRQRRRLWPSFVKPSAVKDDTREQEMVDQILAKVSASGMNSLSKKSGNFWPMPLRASEIDSRI